MNVKLETYYTIDKGNKNLLNTKLKFSYTF